jgi:hypothetical protein
MIELWQYMNQVHVDTEFAILVHEDGFIVNPECWSDEF